MNHSENIVKIKWEEMGAYFANRICDSQAEFLKGFCNEIRNWPTHHARELQMLYIRDLLSEEDQKTLSEYFPALWYNSETDK